MSVREQVYLRTQRSLAEVAEVIAGLFHGRADSRPDHAYVVVETARLVPGASGEFGGPVRPHESELPFRPEGEFEAVDGYNVEIRLGQAYGRRVDPATGTDIEAVAASVLFEALIRAIDDPAIHVHTDHILVRAYLPGKGLFHPPRGTTIFDWDQDDWNGYVLPPDAFAGPPHRARQTR